jgi:hypothetical protein
VANAHILTDFNGLFPYDARDSGANDRVAEIKLCLGEFGLALLNLCICGIRPSDRQRYLLRRSLRSSEIGLRLDKFSL